jgi:hypothetical protein
MSVVKKMRNGDDLTGLINVNCVICDVRSGTVVSVIG